MKALIAVDGSDDGFAAVKQAGQLLVADRDQVALFYSTPEVNVTGTSTPSPEILSRARQALADIVFEEARSRLPAGLHGSLHRIAGRQHPRQGILTASDDWRAELVVVGARGLGPIRTALLGSVSRAVAHASGVPVLVVREPERAAGSGEFRVLLAFDESPASCRAAEVIGQLSFPDQTTGRAITVIESMFAGELPTWLEQQARSADSEAMAQAWVREHDQQREQATEALAELIDQLPTPFHGQQPIVRVGHPGEQILKTIADEAIDLVVVGARGRGMVDRLLVGSTSEKVLAHAPCSVMVVHEHKPL